MNESSDRVRADEESRRSHAEQSDEIEQIEQVQEGLRLSAHQIYEVVRRDGVEEMTRPLVSLLFSGLAAGLLISVSLLGPAVLRAALPDTSWRPMVESLGYTLGFLLVIESRMQLFTENTITTVLPLASRPRAEYFFLTGRLWGVVLMANVVGGLVAALFFAHSGAVSPEVQDAMRSISESAVLKAPLEGFVRAIPAGVLIAAIAWMLPTSPRNPFHIIVTFTWVIAAADFGHVVLGSVEMSYLSVLGELDVLQMVSFFFPALLGNVVGGTLVFAIMAWAQVVCEVE